MREDAELERLLRQLQRKTGQNLLIQTEDGQVLASTFSAKESFLRDAAEESVSIQELAERAKALSLDFTSGRYLLAVRAKDLAKGLIEEAAAAILEDDMEAEFCTRSACGRCPSDPGGFFGSGSGRECPVASECTGDGSYDAGKNRDQQSLYGGGASAPGCQGSGDCFAGDSYVFSDLRHSGVPQSWNLAGGSSVSGGRGGCLPVQCTGRYAGGGAGG